MPEATGTLGLDVTPFKEGLSELSVEIPKTEQKIKQLNAQLQLMEREYRQAGVANADLTKKIQLQRNIVAQEELQLRALNKQYKAFNDVVGESPSRIGAAIKGFNSLKSGIGLLGGGLALGGLISFGKSILNFGSEIKQTSLETGVLPENLQRIQAALANNLSADDASRALKDINTQLREAKKGSAEAEQTLSNLGITFDDIKSKSPDQVLLKIADHIREAKDPVEELRRVSVLFGDDLATKLIPALQVGGAAIKKFGDEATVAGDKQIEAANRGEKALERFAVATKQYALMAIGYMDKWGASLGRAIGEAQAVKMNLPPGVKPGPINPTKGGQPTVIGVPFDSKPSNGSPSSNSTNTTSQLTANLDLLRKQQDVAAAIIPEYQKQASLLQAQRERLLEQQKTLEANDQQKREEIKLQLEQNSEAKRALQLSVDLIKSQAELNDIQSTKGIGYYAEQAVRIAELNKLARDYNKQQAAGHDAEMSAINAERRAKLIEIYEAQNAHDDEIEGLRLQTAEIEAQHKGMLGLVSQIQVTEQYQQKIVTALRNQNTEAAALLQKQQAIAIQASKAAQHDITPAQRVQARREAREQARKARQQDARDAELERRGSGNYSTGSTRSAAPIDPFAGPSLNDRVGAGGGAFSYANPATVGSYAQGAKSRAITEHQMKVSEAAKERARVQNAKSTDITAQVNEAVLNIAKAVIPNS